ncbi:myelin-oligodendrocyte glycoprotein-like [Eucyclogobius newberryi]|uniref:myelin-oligodendrocyte glycoprotein-like n=1 Tax=Eucyclogobius newberryi TaxID=166745 RepID=UPI003B5A6BAB
MVRSRHLRLLLLPVLWSHALENTTNVSHRQVAPLVGEDCELPCLIDSSAKVLVLQWSRPDLDDIGYLLFYRHPRVRTHYQHPDFRARVQLQDPGLDHGDLSLVLKNVTRNDTATYECRLLLENEVSRTTTVQLTVRDVKRWSEEAVSGVRGHLLLPVTALLLPLLIMMMMIVRVVVLKRHLTQPGLGLRH